MKYDRREIVTRPIALGSRARSARIYSRLMMMDTPDLEIPEIGIMVLDAVSRCVRYIQLHNCQFQPGTRRAMNKSLTALVGPTLSAGSFRRPRRRCHQAFHEPSL